MRYPIGFIFVLAAPLSLSLSASAQSAGESESAVERDHREAAFDPENPTPEAGPQTPVLQIELESEGVRIVPRASLAGGKYMLEETELRARRAAIGVGVSVLAFGVGAGLVAGGAVNSFCVSFGEPCPRPAWKVPVITIGSVLSFGGFVGMIASGIALHKRKDHLHRLRKGSDGKARRFGWDLEKSRFVF
jgi:hypothetical protein